MRDSSKHFLFGFYFYHGLIIIYRIVVDTLTQKMLWRTGVTAQKILVLHAQASDVSLIPVTTNGPLSLPEMIPEFGV